MNFVDAHHHIWPASGLPWLDGPMIPRIFGPYEVLQGKPYTAEEYRADALAKGFTQSVYMQANWKLEDSVKEVEWVHEQHVRTGWPHAIVGSADLFAPDAIDTVEAELAASPLLRGVRLQLHWHDTVDAYRFATGPDRASDRTFNENLASFIADTASYNFLRAKYGKSSPEYDRYLHEDQDYRQFSAFILRAATHLDSVYESMNDSISKEEKQKRKDEEIKAIVANMDTLHLRLNDKPSKRYEKRLPNNTYFMMYRHYQARQPVFKEEFGEKFNGDLKSYIKYLSEKYPVL